MKKNKKEVIIIGIGAFLLVSVFAYLVITNINLKRRISDINSNVNELFSAKNSSNHFKILDKGDNNCYIVDDEGNIVLERDNNDCFYEYSHLSEEKVAIEVDGYYMILLGKYDDKLYFMNDYFTESYIFYYDNYTKEIKKLYEESWKNDFDKYSSVSSDGMFMISNKIYFVIDGDLYSIDISNEKLNIEKEIEGNISKAESNYNGTKIIYREFDDKSALKIYSLSSKKTKVIAKKIFYFYVYGNYFVVYENSDGVILYNIISEEKQVLGEDSYIFPFDNGVVAYASGGYNLHLGKIITHDGDAAISIHDSYGDYIFYSYSGDYYSYNVKNEETKFIDTSSNKGYVYDGFFSVDNGYATYINNNLEIHVLNIDTFTNNKIDDIITFEISGNLLYYLNIKNELYVFDLLSRTNKKMANATSLYEVFNSDEKVLYYGGVDGNFYSYNIDDNKTSTLMTGADYYFGIDDEYTYYVKDGSIYKYNFKTNNSEKKADDVKKYYAYNNDFEFYYIDSNDVLHIYSHRDDSNTTYEREDFYIEGDILYFRDSSLRRIDMRSGLGSYGDD